MPLTVLLLTTCSLWAAIPALVSAGLRVDVDNSLKVERTCESVRVPICQALKLYNRTGTPDVPGVSTQLDSLELLKTFNPLIHSKCSKHLPFLLCSVYVPMCSPWHTELIGPCMPTCVEVRENCRPVLEQFGFVWPEALDCEKFPPENKPGVMCMDPVSKDRKLNAVKPLQPNPPATPVQKPPTGVGPSASQPSVGEKPNSDLKQHSSIKTSINADASGTLSLSAAKRRCLGKNHPEAYTFVNSSGQCMSMCSANDAFSGEDKKLIDVWMGVWATICFTCTLLTLITFLLDTSRVIYPERPIIFIALSFALHSLGYLVRLAAGRSTISCDSSQPVQFLVRAGLENTNCTLVFLLLYFFGLAGAAWWAVLCLCWLLRAAVRMPAERISAYASSFHLVAWGVPAVLSIAVVVLRDISGDELTGLCFVDSADVPSMRSSSTDGGNATSDSLLVFVVAPLISILSLSTIFLIAGRVKVTCDRYHCQRTTSSASSSASSSSATASLTKQRLSSVSDGRQLSPSLRSTSPTSTTVSSRAFTFAVMFFVPLACVIACYLYESASRSLWYNRAVPILRSDLPMSSSSLPIVSPEKDLTAVQNNAEIPRPSIAVFMLKIFAWLALGVICCLTVLSDKSAGNAWKRCILATTGGSDKNSRLTKTAKIPSHCSYVPVRTVQGSELPPVLHSNGGPYPPGSAHVHGAGYGYRTVMHIPRGCDV